MQSKMVEIMRSCGSGGAAAAAAAGGALAGGSTPLALPAPKAARRAALLAWVRRP